MESLPPTLYKYFSPDRIDVFQTGLIRYTPIGAFNDPFEGRPEITSLITEASAQESVTEMLSQGSKKQYDELPSELRELLSYEMWQPLFSQYVQTKAPELIQIMNSFTPFVQGLIPENLDELAGAFCLSEIPDSLLMWSHYGASHAGFVLGFDTKHSYFHEKKGTNDELRHLRRVLYREKRPSAPVADFEGTDIFLVKSGHWSYEREWRIFRALREADVVYPGEPFGCHLFRFPPSALQAVIIGARASNQTVEAITAAIRAKDEFRHVRIQRSLPDRSHFLLRIAD